MKTKLFLTFLWLAILAACAKKEEAQVNEDTASAEVNDWAELDSFHMIMAEAFHPFKDSANLEPVKTLAEELASEADKWAAASLPANVDNDEVKGMLAKLKTDTRSLADKVKAGATNEELGADLTTLHDSFHGIMEAWNKSKGKEHKHDH
ncbi:MAG: hypothetical protein DYG99_12360 [Bacteroidetes bacterium CHB5]|nr:hypothetical protein [Bacteroidetes bacterium CHB5]